MKKEQIVYDLSQSRKRWFVSKDEIAEYLGVSKKTVTRNYTNDLTAIGGKTQKRYPVRDVADRIYENMMTGGY